jgi:hypothetical protein
VPELCTDVQVRAINAEMSEYMRRIDTGGFHSPDTSLGKRMKRRGEPLVES